MLSKEFFFVVQQSNIYALRIRDLSLSASKRDHIEKHHAKLAHNDNITGVTFNPVCYRQLSVHKMCFLMSIVSVRAYGFILSV